MAYNLDYIDLYYWSINIGCNPILGPPSIPAIAGEYRDPGPSGPRRRRGESEQLVAG